MNNGKHDETEVEAEVGANVQKKMETSITISEVT